MVSEDMTQMEAPRIDSGRIAEVSHGLDRVGGRDAARRCSRSPTSASPTAGTSRSRTSNARGPQEHGDGVHRAVRVRQEHVHPLLQPHERPHPGREGLRNGALPRRGPLRAATSTRSRSGGASAWSSRSRTRSRSRSTTTSRSARASSGMKGRLDELVEQSLRQAALWDEVKDRLKDGALGLSGGQQQRLCIARALAVEPDVILMDEPASALDPIATTRIEDLMHELKREYTIVIVTHNMQQAARVADMTAFFSVARRRRRRGPARDPRRVRRRRRRSSRRRPTSARRTTSRGDSDESRVPGRARRPRGRVPGGRRDRRCGRSAASSTRSARRTSSSATRSSRSTTRSTTATTRSRSRSSSCSRGRRRSRATFGSCSHSSTRGSTSSAWAISA